MPELEYSNDALSTLSKFHRARFIVYVEGKEDISFWKTVFEMNGQLSVYFREAGGREEIEKYVKKIVEDAVDIVVARDSDYTTITGGQHTHPRVIYTYGYSIENSLFRVESIARIIEIYSRAPFDPTKVDLWLYNFVTAFDELIKLDIANCVFNKGKEVLGPNCTRFLRSNKSHQPSFEKIRQKIVDLRANFTNQEMADVEELLNQSRYGLIHIIRGHFIANAVMNYIKKHSSINVLSHDILYGFMVLALDKASSSEDLIHLKNQIQELLDST